ncbi:homeobox-leucine zipper protein athb-54 [Anaeramoeba flamelloides]|uniref:Homeobox-leucine zipper protein athb-54 n=1 Tax=Anaeramoeba flamelloides TaxID=1746091 RepID=A0ABQ8Z8C0_9EUKA|nr:homeobox-leucine zipper protein athb-54 [Anaeramoeba flamelloides]
MSLVKTVITRKRITKNTNKSKDVCDHQKKRRLLQNKTNPIGNNQHSNTKPSPDLNKSNHPVKDLNKVYKLEEKLGSLSSEFAQLKSKFDLRLEENSKLNQEVIQLQKIIQQNFLKHQQSLENIKTPIRETLVFGRESQKTTIKRKTYSTRKFSENEICFQKQTNVEQIDSTDHLFNSKEEELLVKFSEIPRDGF